MSYSVTYTRNVGDGSTVVVQSGVRRYNGAIHVRDILVDGSRDHAVSHGNGRVVVGPTGDPDAIAVVTITDHGDLVDTFAIVADFPSGR